LDKELTSMVLIQALPDEYSHFVSLLLLMDKLDKDMVQQAFITEEIQCHCRAADAVSVAAMVTASAPLQCEFCSRPGHAQSTCRTCARAQENARKQAASGWNWKQRQGAKKAQETAATVPVVEFAGNASALSDLPDPSSLMQPHADFRWNADTGCTSTMMPHRHSYLSTMTRPDIAYVVGYFG
jgi:hypothetical protein